MAKLPDITTITSANNNITTLNSNFSNLRAQFEFFVSRDGEIPNTLLADLDVNGQDLINVQDLFVQQLYIAGNLVANLGFFPEYKGVWATATTYTAYDLVYHDDGVTQSLYRATSGHTSTTFVVDRDTNGVWERFTDQVIDQADVRITGGSIVGIVDLAVADGGTGASTAAGARTNLDAQQRNGNLDDIAAITQATGDIIYSDGTDFVTLAASDNDRALVLASGIPAYGPKFGIRYEEDTSTAWSAVDDDFAGGKVINANNGSSITVTIPDTLTETESLTIIQGGAGAVTIAAGGTTTLNSKGGNLVTNGQNVAVTLIPVGSNTYFVVGDLIT